MRAWTFGRRTALSLAGGVAVMSSWCANAEQTNMNQVGALPANAIPAIQALLPESFQLGGQVSPLAGLEVADQFAQAEPDMSAVPPVEPAPPPVATDYGPPPAADGAPIADSRDRYRSFGAKLGAVKWELAVGVAFFTATNVSQVIKHNQSFQFENEGYFGDGTANLGVDKTAHAFNDALISDIFYQRLARKTGGGRSTALTASLIGFGLQLYGEVYDGFDRPGGWSWQDVSFDALGSVFSYFRNSVPGLKDKLDFRILITPDKDFYTTAGKAHFEQQRFLLALKLSGFDRFKHGPMRFVELHAGYRATGFTTPQRMAGETLRQRPFVGIGINLQELFFPHPSGWAGKAADTVLQYFQLPYTAVSIDRYGTVSY